MIASRRKGRLVLALSVAALVAGVSACARPAAEGQSQVVEGVKFDYGLVADAAQAPPSSHPDLAMHGGPPSGPNAYHVTLSLTDAKTGRKLDPAEVSVGLSGPGHPGRGIVPMEPMTVNGQASFGHYVLLPDRGPYQVEFRVRAAGRHQPLTARFKLNRPT